MWAAASCVTLGELRLAALCSPSSKHPLLVRSQCLPCYGAALKLNMVMLAILLAGTWFGQTLSW